jgi:hypothetical protein
MSEEANAIPASGGDTSPAAPMPFEVTAPANAPESVNSVSAAAKMLRAARKEISQESAPQEASAPDTPSSVTDDAAPLDTEAPGATEATPDPAAEPPVEPPRSWTAEEKEAFRSLPREAQSRIAEREHSREADFRRRQNEVAEQRKATDAEREKMAQARTQYESALPQLLQNLHQNPEFADVRTMEDVERMANEDWPRFARWQFHQQKVAAVEAELKATQSRQEQEKRTPWEHFAKRQDELFLERAPEMQDATKRTKTTEAATKLLQDIGYTPEELGHLWQTPAFRDHRMQQLILQAVRFQDAKQQAINAAKKPLPPVQRPGVSQPGRGVEAKIHDLETRLDRSSGIMNQVKAAAALVAAKRATKR